VVHDELNLTHLDLGLADTQEAELSAEYLL
jgi:hypothetical protein